ncbi:hypothetical protein ACQRBL_07880, partial [Bacillus sp. AF62]
YYHSSRKTGFFMHSFLDIYEFCNTLNNYIQLGSKEYNQELTVLIGKLKQCGVKEERYKDFEKSWMIFFNVFVIAIAGLLVLKYLM